MSDRAALWHGSRRRWLIPAGVISVVAVGALIAALGLQTVVPIVGIVVVAALFLTMLACAWAIPVPARRNTVLAWLEGALAIVIAATFVVLLAVEATR